MSTGANGAVAEATQGFAHKFHPLTLCSHDADCTDIIDLTTEEARKAADVSLDDMAREWMEEISNNRKPSSWAVYARYGNEAAGILVPSFANCVAAGTTNLVLWDWGPDFPHRVEVFDPETRLPMR